MELNFNISASSLALYEKSELQFYYQYIAKSKPDTITNSAYADAGNILHNSLEEFIKTRDFDKAKKFFNDEWFDKEATLIGFNGKPLSKEDYFNCFLKGVELIGEEYNIIEAEPEFLFPLYKKVNLKGFIDAIAVDKDGNIKVIDWKSNSSIQDFTTHAKVYALLIYKRDGVVPTELIYEYLKLGKTKIYSFTLNEILQFEQHILRVVKEIEEKGTNISEYSLGDFNHPFNSHKRKCMEENSKRVMGNYIGGMIQQNKIFFTHGLPEDLNRIVNKFFSYKMKNSHWIPSVQEGHWDGVVRFYKKHSSGYMTLPLGFINKLKDIVRMWNSKTGKSYKLNLTDMRHESVMEAKFKTKFKDSNIVFRDYQLEAIEVMLEKKIMIANLAPSSGKTLISAEFSKRVNKRTLFLVSRIELAEQTRDAYENHLGVSVGMMVEGNLDVSKQFTVCSIQTIYSILKRDNDEAKKLKHYLYNVNVCCWDESHDVNDTKYYNTLHSLLINAEYIIGLTGTAWKPQENTLEMNALVGFPEYVKTTQELEAGGYITPTRSLFIDMQPPNDALESEDYHENYDSFIVYHQTRNSVIANIVKKHPHKKIMIIVSRIKHGEILNDMIPNSFFINGSTKRSLRKDKMAEFKDPNSSLVLISMVKIVSTGLNVESLDVVINASANRSSTDTIQILGRAKRLYEGKKMGYYIGFMDRGLFSGSSRDQMRILKAHDESMSLILQSDEVVLE